jgi:hypothetical protein
MKMRKLLYVLGAAFLALIVVVVSTVGYFAYVGNKLDQEAKRYVDDAVPAIVADWSVDELRRRASPELLQTTKPDDLRSLFALFAKLGPLVQYEGSKGDANLFVSAGSGQTITANYVARATFKNGGASIEIVLRKLDGTWKVQGFRVNSTEMIENAVGRAS